MKHPYADILIAIANGEKIEYYCANGWCRAYYADALSLIAQNNPHLEFRIKPKTIMINGHEVPEPMKEDLKNSDIYLYPSFHTEDLYEDACWTDDPIDTHRLNNCIIHSTKEAAIKHAEALISFTKVKE